MEKQPAPERFSDLNLSPETMKGLNNAKYYRLTDVQLQAIPPALEGKDVVGCAKTGSGKTLAFIVPLLERLQSRVSVEDGSLGAIVLSPTRELALQIFETLNKVGKYHHMSAGLITGGKDHKQEAERIGMMNILIATPGRLLQHLSQVSDLRCDNVEMLVLDEADRILDMGFKKDVDAILQYLPTDRQTLLFSATQTRSVKDLARLSLRRHVPIWANGSSEVATPQKLVQKYMVVDIADKVDMIWSFIVSHKQSKTIIFLSSGKQVAFLGQAFQKLRPGVSTHYLHGKMNQKKRFQIVGNFSLAEHAVLLCTDIAARGLDINQVDWVLQADCPENVDTYIHRVGRTARYKSGGKGLLFLLPSEVGFVEELQKANIPLGHAPVNADRVQSIRKKLAGLVTEFKELNHLAQRAVVTYARSIHLNSNKAVFDLNKLDLTQYSLSLGLAVAPKLKVDGKRIDKNEIRSKEAVKNKFDSDDDEEALFNVKPSSIPTTSSDPKTMGKKELKKAATRGHHFGTHITFDSDDESGSDEEKVKEEMDIDKEQSGVESEEEVERESDESSNADDEPEPASLKPLPIQKTKRQSSDPVETKSIDDRFLRIREEMSKSKEAMKEQEKARVRELHRKKKEQLKQKTKIKAPKTKGKVQLASTSDDDSGPVGRIPFGAESESSDTLHDE